MPGPERPHPLNKEAQDPEEPTWTVGELAERTGVTVRTLHHYDELGLLPPATRTRAGYRLYGRAEVERLQTILSLKATGLELERIGEALERPEMDLRRAVEMHLERLDEEVARARRLRDRLRAVLEWADQAGRGEAVSVETILESMEMTVMYEKYFTEEQREKVEARREEVGEARIEEAQREWATLIEQVRQAMEDGAEPTSERVRPLARKWKELVEEFTGGDQGIARSVGRMYQEEPRVQRQMGLDMEMFGYMGRAMGELGGEAGG